MANLYGQLYAFAMNDDGTFQAHVNLGYVQSGVAVNFSVVLDVAAPILLNIALFNLNIQTAVKNYANANYATSFLATDVILLGGINAV